MNESILFTFHFFGKSAATLSGFPYTAHSASIGLFQRCIRLVACWSTLVFPDWHFDNSFWIKIFVFRFQSGNTNQWPAWRGEGVEFGFGVGIRCAVWRSRDAVATGSLFRPKLDFERIIYYLKHSKIENRVSAAQISIRLCVCVLHSLRSKKIDIQVKSYRMEIENKNERKYNLYISLFWEIDGCTFWVHLYSAYCIHWFVSALNTASALLKHFGVSRLAFR